MVKLLYNFQAKDDFKNIHSFIVADSSLHAKRFVQAVKLHTAVVKEYPELGSLVYHCRFTNLRKLLYKSYRIIYHYSHETVTILTIRHQSRLIENIAAITKYTE